jgi:hypothetical protein
MGAVPAQLPPDQRVGVGAYRLGIGRQVDAGAVAAHVMVVHVGFGLPITEQDGRHVLRFDEVRLEGVAVVIVAGVLVVEPGQVRALVLGAETLVVPVGHHDLAIRVEGGHHDEDDVVENAGGVFVMARDEIVGELRRHLGTADLAGVEAHGLADHGAPLGGQLADFRLGEAARVGDREVHLPQAFQAVEIRG